MITTEDFPKLTDDLQSIFNEVASRKIGENVGFKIFDVRDTNRLTYDHLILHGVAGIKRVAEGQDLPRLTTEEGDNITYTQEYYGAIVPITKKMRKFDLHDQIESIVRSASADAFDKVDQSMADLIGHGFSTSYTDVYGQSISSVGPDGLALFSASHSNNLNSNTFSNIITDGTNTNPALSRDAIVYARQAAMVHKDPNNLVRPINLDTLIVTPYNLDLAERICYSDYLPGSANNDRNPLKGKIRNIICYPRLQTLSDSTDCKAYWFLADSTGIKESLKALFAERPALDAPEEVYSNKNWDYSIDFFYSLGRGYPAYIFGSKGDNT